MPRLRQRVKRLEPNGLHMPSQLKSGAVELRRRVTSDEDARVERLGLSDREVCLF